MASDSDSDCEIYTKTAEHVKFQSRVEEIEDVVNMASDKEVSKLLIAVDSGMSPMEALLKVQMEPMTSGTLITHDLTTSQSNSIEVLSSSSSLLSDGPIELHNVKKKNTRTPKTKSGATRVSTRASTRVSTRASLSKAKQSDIRTNSQRNVVHDAVVVVEDEETPEGQGSVAQGSRRKRGRPSKANKGVSKRLRTQTVTPSSSGRDLGTIVFDDDSEYCNMITNPINFVRHSPDKLSLSLNNDSSSDIEEDSSDNIPVKVTIEWTNDKGLARKSFQLRKYQKFESVFEDLAKLEGISANRVILMKQFTSIRPSDSPATLNMNFYGALTGFISPTDIVYEKGNLSAADEVEMSEKKREGAISVKVQLETKQTLAFTLLKYSKMDTLYLMACEELKCDKDKLKLVFDGDYVSPNEKLSNLDIEDGDVLHAYIKK